MHEIVILIASLLAVVVSSQIFFARRGLRYLQYLQQDDYEGRRFLKWYEKNRAFDRRASLVAVSTLAAILVASSFSFVAAAILSFFGSLTLWHRAGREENPLASGKILLKLTERARRIFDTAQSCYALCQLVCALLVFWLERKYALPIFWVCQMVLIQLQPFILVLAKVLLDPQEKELQSQFARQAQQIVKQTAPLVVGITGSYGKTSAKVILSDMLNAAAPTFTTPRSINSYMGVTREIRERMKPCHKFAVIEMGAYYKGSIARMCSLTPPKVGLVTALGQMHLERFGSLENLFQAKSELAQAVPSDGILVLNGDYEACRRMAKENPKRVALLYGMDKSKGNLDAYMHSITTSDKGTTFKIDFDGKVYEGFTRLLGRPLLSNALGAFVVAVTLGCVPEVALAAMRNVKTENNRLEPVRTTIGALGGGVNGKSSQQILRLNDAFNSNPIGFSAALDVLAEVAGARKVLVTPGMIELGANQQEENRNAAKKAASVCDLVVVVGRTNKEALLAGLKEGGLPEDRYVVQDNMRDALQYLGTSYCGEGDVVLIENDLSDLYESIPQF
jgi:UDP-N-acetylmuramoyl-tripeptide--D-alanyl-D-alanine ligase